METISTDVLIRDPSEVTLERPNGDVVLPASKEQGEAPLDEGRVETGPESSAQYQVMAHREESRAISIEWSTSLPLEKGERYEILPAKGNISFNAPLSGVVTPEMRAAPTLAFPWCTTIGSSSSRYGTSYRVEPRGCSDMRADPNQHSGLASAPYVLATPWSNVVEIRERTRIEKGSAWVVVGLATLSFGAFSTMLFSFKNSSFKGGAPTRIILGTGTAAIGAAFDFAMLPTLFASDRDVVIHH